MEETAAAVSRPLDVLAALPRKGQRPAGPGWLPFRYLSHALRLRPQLAAMPESSYRDALARGLARLQASGRVQLARDGRTGWLRWFRAVPAASPAASPASQREAPCPPS